MNTTEIKKTMAILLDVPILLNYKSMSKPARLWVHNTVFKYAPVHIFAKINMDDTISYYSEEGLLLGIVKYECRFPVEMYNDEVLVGAIRECQTVQNDSIKLIVFLVANPKIDNPQTSELAKFREEIIRRFG